MLIIGVDPGSRYTGYGIIERTPNGLRHVASGRINATRAEDFFARLEVIYEGLVAVLEEYPCDVAAVETIFTARNVQSTLKLGQARGVTLLALRHAALPVAEYPPATVKKAVAGHGRAAKEDVQEMVKRTLSIRGALASDAADALAVAICHSQDHDVSSRLQRHMS